MKGVVELSQKAGVGLSLDKLVHLLVTSSSGGGKSTLLRLLLERTHGQIQQLVLDWEGEFFTLRDKYDYVLVGKDGDLPAHSKAARMFARRVLDLGFSAIVDLSELVPSERLAYARDVLEELVEAPREQWRDLLIVVDEAHYYSPETERRGKASVAKDVLVDVAARGRKRGYKLVVATQRLAKLDKDVAAECGAKIVGKTNSSDDRKRAIEELAARANKADMGRTLASFRPGEFLVMGEALHCDDATLVRVDLPLTKAPPRGMAARKAPAPSATIRKALEQLSDLPQRAEEELRTIEQLRGEVDRLEREVRKANQAKPETITEKVEVPIVSQADMARIVTLGRTCDELVVSAQSMREEMDAIRVAVEQAADVRRKTHVRPMVKDRTPPVNSSPRVVPRAAARGSADGGLAGPERRILEALAKVHLSGTERPTKEHVAAWSGYSVQGGAFNNPLGKLRSKGLVDKVNDGTMALTQDGWSEVGNPEKMSTKELLELVRGMLDGPKRRILDVVLEYYPDPVPKADLAREAGYEPTGGAFNNPLGRLRTMGLVEYSSPGMVRAAGFLVGVTVFD